MSWGAPESLVLLAAAPIAVLLGWWWWQRATRALAAWAARSQWHRLGVDASTRRLAWRLVLLFLAIASMAAAVARPRWGESEQTVEIVGVDTVAILDTSASMRVEDVTPSRSEVARAILGNLTRELEGHRLALVQMEGTVRALTPMTADMEAVRLALDSARINSLERPGTDLGLALERGAEMFLPGEERHRAILVVTDGEDHGEQLGDAMRQLASEGVAVHVLAIGTPDGGPIPIAGAGPGTYKQDANGQIVMSKLAADSLRELADVTGGTLVTVERAGQSIDPIVDAILSLERRSLGTETVVLHEERFQLPLLLAVLALVAMSLVSPLRPARGAA